MSAFDDGFSDDYDDTLELLAERGYHLWKAKPGSEERSADVFCLIPDDIGTRLRSDLSKIRPINNIVSNRVYKHLGGNSHAIIDMSADRQGNASGVGLYLSMDDRQYNLFISDEGLKIISNAAAMSAEISVKQKDMLAAGNVLIEYGLGVDFPEVINSLVEEGE